MPSPADTADGNDIQIRLLQYKPSWSLHCLLRFKDLPYVSENTGSKESLGLRVPILIDGNFVFSERLAIEHLSMDRQTRSANGEYPPDSYDMDPVHEQFTAADKQMTDHIEVSLLLVYQQLESLIEARTKKGLFGLSITTRAIGNLRSMFKTFDVSADLIDGRSYSECDTEVLLVRLDAIYSELDTLLSKNKGFLISISVTAPTLVTASANLILGGQKNIARNRGTAEAILFGHLVEAISNPAVSTVIKKYKSLTSFVRNILEEYFLTPMKNPKNSLRFSLWEDATTSILENKLFLGMPDSALRDSFESPFGPNEPTGYKDVSPLRANLTDRSYCSPRRSISPRSSNDSGSVAPIVVTSPRRHASPRSPKPSAYKKYDLLGSEQTREQIELTRLIGPSTILDLRSEYCGCHVMMPHFFHLFFPHLTVNSGFIRLTARNSFDTLLEGSKSDGSEIDMEKQFDLEIEREKQIDKEFGLSRDGLNTLELSHAKPHKSSVLNKEVEMSLLGVIFMATIGSAFLVNLSFGSF